MSAAHKFHHFITAAAALSAPPPLLRGPTPVASPFRGAKLGPPTVVPMMWMPRMMLVVDNGFLESHLTTGVGGEGGEGEEEEGDVPGEVVPTVRPKDRPAGRTRQL